MLGPMNLRVLWLLMTLLGLAAPAMAQVAPVSSPTGPVMAGPYAIIDAATGETLLEQIEGLLLFSVITQCLRQPAKVQGGSREFRHQRLARGQFSLEIS